MDLLTNTDTVTICADCGQPCRQREIVASHGRHARQVPFQTHAQNLAGEDHAGVFQRVSRFYSKMFELVDELQKIPGERLKVAAGRLSDLDLGAVMPSACAVRTDIVPLAFVRANGYVREIQLDPQPLDESSVDEIVQSLRLKAEPIIETLNAL